MLGKFQAQRRSMRVVSWMSWSRECSVEPATIVASRSERCLVVRRLCVEV